MKYLAHLTALLFAFVCFSEVSAQDPDVTLAKQFHDSTKNLILAKKYDEALVMGQKTLDLYLQTLGEQDSLTGSIHYTIGSIFYRQGYFNKTVEYYQKALDIWILVLGSEHSFIAKSYHNLGGVYGKIGNDVKALEFSEKALDHRLRNLGPEHPHVGSSYNSLGSYYYSRGVYDQAKLYYEKALEIRQKALGNEDPAVASSYHNLGLISNVMGDYDHALKYYEKALAIHIASRGEEHPSLAITYNSMGITYGSMGNFNKALEFFEKCLAIRLKSLGPRHPNVAQAYHNIGIVNKNKGDYEKAATFYQKTLEIQLTTVGPRHPKVAQLYNNLGTIYMDAGELNQAMDVLQKARDIFISLYGTDHLDLAQTYNAIAAIYVKKRKLSQALEAFEKALEIRLRVLGEEHLDVAESYNNIAVIYEYSHDYEEALTLNERALEIALLTQGKEHPKVANMYSAIGDILTKLGDYDKAITHHQNALDLLVATQGDNHPYIPGTYSAMSRSLYLKKDYITAMEYAEKSITALEEMQRDFSSSESRQTYLALNYQLFENALNVLTHSAIHPDSLDIEKAFSLSEKAKSNGLLDVLQSSDIRTFAGIPDSLMQKEYDLGAEIANYKQARLNELSKGKERSDSLILGYHDKLFELSQEYDGLIDEFEQRYPEYFSLKYDRRVAGIDDIQASLTDSTVFIEYFLGDSNIYLFGIDQHETLIHSIKVSPKLLENVDLYLELIKNPTWDSSTMSQISSLGYELYQTLLDPLLSHMKAQHLIIVPDGKIGYLPFDLLITEKSSNPTSYSQLSFLIRKYQVQYEYSATLLLQRPDRDFPSNNMYSGFAPHYGLDQTMAGPIQMEKLYPQIRKGFSPLRYNLSEVAEAADIWNGKSYLRDQASERIFKARSTGHRMIHLAMHTLMNDSLPQYSGMVFTPDADSTEDHFLYAYELYKMQLDAELAVLSACETGLGKIQRGEGIMSLARAFKYAGCPNIVMSLWKADDRATADIIVDFFANLKAGMPKAAALRKAKLAYLDQAPAASSHPFYWGTFVLIGDDTPIDMPRKWWPYSIICLLVLGLLAWRVRRR